VERRRSRHPHPRRSEIRVRQATMSEPGMPTHRALPKNPCLPKIPAKPPLGIVAKPLAQKCKATASEITVSGQYESNGVANRTPERIAMRPSKARSKHNFRLADNSGAIRGSGQGGAPHFETSRV
jgi:hypothetical protein